MKDFSYKGDVFPGYTPKLRDVQFQGPDGRFVKKDPWSFKITKMPPAITREILPGNTFTKDISIERQLAVPADMVQLHDGDTALSLRLTGADWVLPGLFPYDKAPNITAIKVVPRTLDIRLTDDSGASIGAKIRASTTVGAAGVTYLFCMYFAKGAVTPGKILLCTLTMTSSLVVEFPGTVIHNINVRVENVVKMMESISRFSTTLYRVYVRYFRAPYPRDGQLVLPAAGYPHVELRCDPLQPCAVRYARHNMLTSWLGIQPSVY